MKKLRNKVFSVIFIILTIFLISILFIFNFQNYNKSVSNVKDDLMRMDNNDEFGGEKSEGDKELSKNQPQIFMDLTMYTVLLDENLNIKDIINHTTKNTSDDEIKEIANKILNDKNRENSKIGNLYFTKYSYSFNMNKTALIIMDNSSTKSELIDLLKISILIFIILEIVIVITSNKLTEWIIKPVQETFNKQKQFIADASHELKTPLSVIIASAEALEKEPEEKKWLENIKDESVRMNNLVGNLLEMARSENQIKEKYKKEDLSKIVQKSVLTFESIIFEKNIKLNYNIDENIQFLCNQEQIKQLVGILMDNAVKHSTKDNGEINVKLKKEKKNIILTISNKGKEIKKEDRERIFERFYRVDESRNRNENRYGLGLAIAKNIVNNHEGKIMVECQNGYTTFKIIFNVYLMFGL